MEHVCAKQNPIWQRICVALLLLTVTVFLFSFTITRKLADDFWQQLGISQQQGSEKIKNSFINNYLDHTGMRNFKNISTGDRAVIALDLLQYAKQYINSASFTKEYEALRSNAKPTQSTTALRTKEEIRKEKIEETKTHIKETEELIKNTTPELKPTFETVLEMHKNNLKEYQDPNSAMIDLFFQGEEYKKQNDEKDYIKAEKQWQTNYPTDVKQFIKSRLQHYINVAATVNFAAETIEKNGKKRFADAAYEARSDEWKMIYRAGKEVYDVTRPFAEQWMKEL